MEITESFASIDIAELGTITGGAVSTAQVSSQALTEASQSVIPPFAGGGGAFGGAGATGSWRGGVSGGGGGGGGGGGW